MIKNIVYKAVERRLYTFHDLEQAVALKRAERMAHKGSMDGGNGHAFISDPTARYALKELEPVRWVTLNEIEDVEWPEKWIEIIRKVYQDMEPTKQKVVAMRYFRRKPVTNISCNEPTGERTIYSWCKDFVEEVGYRAIGEHLIKLDTKTKK